MTRNANPYRPPVAAPLASPREERPEPVSLADRILCGLGRSLSAVGFTTFVLATAVAGYRIVGATLLDRASGNGAGSGVRGHGRFAGGGRMLALPPRAHFLANTRLSSSRLVRPRATVSTASALMLR